MHLYCTSAVLPSVAYFDVNLHVSVPGGHVIFLQGTKYIHKQKTHIQNKLQCEIFYVIPKKFS